MRNLSDQNIWRLEVRGANRKAAEPVNLISSTYAEDSPQYSPDGKSVAFVSLRSGSNEIWVCRNDGSNPVQLTSLGSTGSPHWSPDGRSIVFDSNLEGGPNIYIIDGSGGKPRRMTNHPSMAAVANFSRDGRWIYFASNRANDWQIWKMPAAGGEPTQVTRHGGHIASESLDGKFVYFTKEFWKTTLWRVPVDGGEEEKVEESVLGQAFAPAREGIYFVALHPDGRSAVRFHSFATGKVTTVAAIHRPVGWGLALSPDERYLLYTQVDRSGSDLMLVENFR
jgi:dipeptidyl aminopeptidase/acylaminoacyl peptidase